MGLLCALFISQSLYPFHLSIPLYPSLSLSLPLSPSLSLYFPLSHSLSLSIPLSPSLSLSIPLYPSLLLSLSFSLSPSLPPYLSFSYLTLLLYISPATFLSLSFLLSLFSFSFSLAYLMDVFLLVIYKLCNIVNIIYELMIKQGLKLSIRTLILVSKYFQSRKVSVIVYYSSVLV